MPKNKKKGADARDDRARSSSSKDANAKMAPLASPSSLFPSGSGLNNNEKLPFRATLGDSKTLYAKMSSSVVTTNPGLIAIAFVIRSRDGPRFVFHYPAQPATSANASQRGARYGTELDQGEFEDEDQEGEDESDESDLENDGFLLGQGIGKLNLTEKAGSSRAKPSGVGSTDDDDHIDFPNGEHFVPWEHLAEFSTEDLESILTPSRAFHKKKFELSLDPLYFVSYPIHVREDGFWKKKKVKKSKKPVVDEEKDKNEKAEARAGDNTSDGDDHGGMTMFNAVFVLNVPRDEEDERIADMYEHVIKKFNKALKHAQAQSNYVWKESEMILSMKEKGREERKFHTCSDPFVSLISHKDAR
jgi:hypothetical protein